MKPIRLLLAVLMLLNGTPLLFAEVNFSYTPEARYAGVSGDRDKFESMNWMQSGFDAGIKEFTLKDENYYGYDLLVEGRAMPGNADYDLNIHAVDTDWGYWRFAWDQFRKYYDSDGGVFPLVRENMRYFDLDRELFLTMGKFEFEIGLTPADLPDLDFLYEYEYKRGTKTRLNWSEVTSDGFVRKITPTFQDINEDVHVVEVKAHDTFGGPQWLKGANWLAEQKWEVAQSENMREERLMATTATAADYKIRDHFQSPESYMIQTIFHLDRWLIKDKLHGSTGYRYSQIENEELENLIEMTGDRGVTNAFSNPEQIRNAVATNQFTTHTGVINLMYVFSKNLTSALKLKAEDARRESFSNYPADKAAPAPDGVIDQNDWSDVDDQINKYGEALSLRYTGIPKTAIYNDIEFEQVRSNLIEDRASGSSGELFNRHTVNQSYRGSETIGFNYYHSEFMTLNGHYRHRTDLVDYDDLRETIPAATGAKSAFVDGQKNVINELLGRTTLKFHKWFSPTLRYHMRIQDYILQFEGSPNNVGSETVSNIYAFDLPLEITKDLYLSGSYAFEDAWTKTQAEDMTTFSFPHEDADVHTLGLTADYIWNDKTSFNAAFQYQTSDNYIDFTTLTLPLGTAYEQFHIIVGAKWLGYKDWTIEPRYGYYRYEPNDDVEVGSYDAHVTWLAVTIPWA